MFQLTETSLKWTTRVDPWHHLVFLVTLYKDTSLKWTLRNGPIILQYFSILLYKADTSLKWTPKVDLWHPFVFLLTLFKTDTSFKWTPEFILTVIQSFSLTVYKMDTSIKWTPRAFPAILQSFSLPLHKVETSLKCTTRAQPSPPRRRVCLVTQHPSPALRDGTKTSAKETKLDLSCFCISSTCNRRILSRILISSPVKACWYIVVAVTQEDSLKRRQLYFISRNVDKGNKKCPSILTKNKRNSMQSDLIVSTHQHLLQVALLEVVLSGWGSLLNNERGRLPHTSLTADQG